MGRELRFDLYSGYADDKTHTEKDVWVQCDGESDEELAAKIYEQILENIMQLRADDEGVEDANNQRD